MSEQKIGDRTRGEWDDLILHDSYHGYVLVAPKDSLQALIATAARVQRLEEALQIMYDEWMDQAHHNPEGAPLLCMHSQRAEDLARAALAAPDTARGGETMYYHLPHEFDAPGPRDSFTSCRTCGKDRGHEQHAEKPEPPKLEGEWAYEPYRRETPEGWVEMGYRLRRVE